MAWISLCLREQAETSGEKSLHYSSSVFFTRYKTLGVLDKHHTDVHTRHTAAYHAVRNPVMIPRKLEHSTNGYSLIAV